MSSTFSSRKLVERTVGGKQISIETGFLAKQASGSVVVRIGDTMTLVAVVAGPGREGLDFFPLTVDYREKTYAAGKFPGGFIKREGRPTTKEILTSRLIDRPIRPLFPESYRDEVQIQAGPISADRQNDPDVLSMIGASAALVLARVPFFGPVGAIRLGRVDGQLVAFPTAEEMEESDLDLIVSSTEKAIVMIEGFGEELPEPEMGDAIMEAHRLNQELIALQKELVEAVGLPPFELPETPVDALRQTIYDRYGDALRETKQIVMKAERNSATRGACRRRSSRSWSRPRRPPAAAAGDSANLPGRSGAEPGSGRRRWSRRRRVKAAFSAVEERVVRELILDGKRPDGRGPKDLRSIKCEVGLVAAGARLGGLPAGRDPGPGDDRAGHRRRRAASRRHHGRVQQEVHARLQHAVVRRRRGAADSRPGPARDRARRPGRAVGRADPAGPVAFSVHDPRGLRHPRVQRLELDGFGLRRDAEPDGRRRADQRSGGRHLDRAGAGRGQPAGTSC